MATLGGDEASGKSLVVLAVDSVMNPNAYPDGIQQQQADMIMHQRPHNSLGFYNAAGAFYLGQTNFDTRLRQFKWNFPEAKAIMCSNMIRGAIYGRFNYAAEGLQSDRLDLNIDFEIVGRPFERRLNITTENLILYAALQKTGFDLG